MPTQASADPGRAPAVAPAIRWRPWTPDLFPTAQKDDRLVLLYLEAVWCHWCHVMDHETYANPEVIALIERRFVPVRVDQDARPDLALRYRDYGWPATIVFAPDGTELAKRRGYLEATELLELLNRLAVDPKPEPDAVARPITPAARPILTDAVREDLRKSHLESYDPAQGGLTLAKKFLDRDTVEYGLLLGRAGDAEQDRRTRQYLDAARALVDPVWGGIYQYSTGRRWDEPHFEKIMSFQAGAMTAYALAGARFGEPAYFAAARDIRRYLERFLTSPEGGFYTSQDADLKPGEHSADYFALDDAGRRARGIPRIDRHVYARENGWAIEALCTLYEATGDSATLEAALRAARWVVAHRSLPGGGFRHDEADTGGPWLGDTLAMGRAALALYRATADRAWLEQAIASARFMRDHFPGADGAGFVTAPSSGSPLPAVVDLDENLALVRFANLLHRFTGDAGWKAMAEQGMRYLAAPEVATSRLTDPGILMAELELAHAPLHVTVVGAKGDATAKGLFAAALRLPGWYRRVEWWDPSEGPLPNPDVQYPALSRAAAFLCSESSCSAPIFAAEALPGAVARLER